MSQLAQRCNHWLVSCFFGERIHTDMGRQYDIWKSSKIRFPREWFDFIDIQTCACNPAGLQGLNKHGFGNEPPPALCL